MYISQVAKQGVQKYKYVQPCLMEMDQNKLKNT